MSYKKSIFKIKCFINPLVHFNIIPDIPKIISRSADVTYVKQYILYSLLQHFQAIRAKIRDG